MQTRIPCLNPGCQRTAKREGDVDYEIVCAKCWKLLPVPMKQRYKQLKRRIKIVDRIAAKGVTFRRRGRFFGAPDRGEPQAFSMGRKIDKLWAKHWDRIRSFYLSPEKPAGLDTFLEELFRG